MSELIILSPEQVVKAYTENGVNPNRIKNMEQKFVTIPDQFTAKELIFVELTVGDKTLKSVPAFRYGDEKSKHVLVGQLRGQYTDKKEASLIKKDGANFGRYLVVNNKFVNDFAEGLSEAEFVSYCLGKNFKATKAKDFPVYSGKFVGDKVEFHLTAAEALDAIKPKSYRKCEVI